jgi:hypothetical protein
MDVTDTYVEQVRPDPTSPSGLSTVFRGQLEHVVAIAETFKVNTRTPGQDDTIVTVPPPLPGLQGIPTDGGFNTVDASSHGARADSANEFMFVVVRCADSLHSHERTR